MTPDQIAERHMLEAMRYSRGALVYVCTCGTEFDDTRWHARHVAEAMEASILGPSEPLAEWERELLEPPSPPFPNAPMVVAEGRLWIRDPGGHYWLPDISEWRSPYVRFNGDAIPVQVVSAGAYEALLARLDESRPDRTANQRRVVVTRAAEQLRDCTEALRWRA